MICEAVGKFLASKNVLLISVILFCSADSYLQTAGIVAGSHKLAVYSS